MAANRRQQKKAVVKAAGQAFDSFANAMARLGRGTGNLNEGAGYSYNPMSRDRSQIEQAYRGSWIAGLAVDTQAEDMTREKAKVISKDVPADLEELDQEIERLQLWSQLCDTIKWARLYGGAVGFFMIQGQNPVTPLRLETVGRGQFKGILPMDRWMVYPDLTRLVQDYGPDFGKPMFYDVIGDMNNGLPTMRIHYSRIIRLEGEKLPYLQRIAEMLWGMSILERPWDRVIAYDSVTTGVAQLVYRSYLRTMKIKDLRGAIAAGNDAMNGVLQQMNMIKFTQSNEGLTLLDSEDEFETHSYTFSGLPEVMSKFEDQIAGAFKTPRTRLFGESPGGLGSNGESELSTYYDAIKQQQVADLGPGCLAMYILAYQSLFGRPWPKGAKIQFNPLWQMNSVQKGALAQQIASSVTGVYNAQIIDRTTALSELRTLSQETGVFTNITDEAIAEAKNDPAPTAEALGLAIPAKPGSDGGPAKA